MNVAFILLLGSAVASQVASVPVSHLSKGHASEIEELLRRHANSEVTSGEDTIIMNYAYYGSMKLQCPSGKNIMEVQFASYGTPGYDAGSWVIGACHASQSHTVISDACLGSASCSIPVSNSNFGGDPCPGTWKYLVAQVLCSATGPDVHYVSSAVTEGNDMHLECPSGSVFAAVHFGTYGVPDGNDGSGDYTYTQGDCHAESTETIVHNECAGRTSCIVHASDSVFGKPCDDDKLLVVTIKCDKPVESVVDGIVPQGSTLHLSCPSGSHATSVLFASYGTSTGTSHESFARSSCHADSSNAIADDACLGHTSCSIAASDSVFGQPCGGSKHLSVAVRCSSLMELHTDDIKPEGKEIQLTCPQDCVLGDVTFASFGTPTGSSYEDFATSSCHSSSSDSVVSNACHQHNTCKVMASTSSFGNPCSGAKHLAASAQCSEAIDSKITPNGSTADLTCPHDWIISSVHFASFGQPLGSSYLSFQSVSSCHSSNSRSAVEDACLGKSSCSVTANTATFGTPCSGNKHLSVAVECSEPIASDIAAEGSDLHLSCPSGFVLHSVPFSSYGTPTGLSYRTFEQSSCHAADSTSVIEAHCVGHNSCTVSVTNDSIGSDPCPGTTKHMAVTARCQRA